MTLTWWRIGPWAASVTGWLALLGVTARYAWLSVTLGDEQPHFVHFDWHAYAAGAIQLGHRSLYREPLELGPLPLPLQTFNLPPLAAAEAAPFLALGLVPGGVAWQVAGAVGVAVAAVVLGWLVSASRRGAVIGGGMLLAGYVVLGHLLLREPLAYWWGLTLGTNNYLVLGLVAAFACAAVSRHDRAAGVLLGLAAATKLWPITLAVVVLRERRWTTLAWGAGVGIVQAAVFLAWLGPDVVPHFLRSLGASDAEPSGITGLAAIRTLLPWWPTWAGWVVAAVLLAIPARGTVGIGLGILAGLAVITNLWGHYLATILFAIGLLVLPLVRRPSPGNAQRTTVSTRSSMSSAMAAPATRNGPNGM